MNEFSIHDLRKFSRHITQRGTELYRSMRWREDTRPYYVLVSELMLQQTQVARVIPKFEAFIERFPDEQALASASLADILKLWQGLGYNRRAKFLHEAAKMIVHDFDKTFPNDEHDIVKLPGVGKNTAGAILAYAYNKPTLYIETNIRTVYIHHFFNNDFDVNDRDVLKLLDKTLDRENPRTFYWGLMDYGSHLKAQGVRNIDQSRHYKKQSKLEGSVRQLRGAIVRSLSNEDMKLSELNSLHGVDERFEPALYGLIRDGLVQQTDDTLHLTK